MIHRLGLLLILIIGLISIVYLVSQRTGFFSQAGVSTAPKSIRITNISDNSFNVSWVTDKAATGFVSIKNQASGAAILDDRDKSPSKERMTHYVTVDNLEPGTAYAFVIHSGADIYENYGRLFTQTTAPTVEKPPAPPDPIFGKVTSNNGLAPREGLVYLNIGQNPALSTIIKNDGKWLITLNNARTPDLKNFVTVNDTDKADIEVAAGSNGSAGKQVNLSGRVAAVNITLQASSAIPEASIKDLNGDGVINVFDYAAGIWQLIIK